MKEDYRNILKVVACTIFALLVWETSLSKDIESRSIHKTTIKENSIYTNISNTIENMNDFFMKPFNGHKEDK
ncbi:hypothetical protein D3C76_1662340 [compost metagenome]